jgi:putative sigma-54 modulation protein
MDIQIQAVGFKADTKLKEFVAAKIQKLAQFSDKLVTAEVFFRLENTQDEDNKVSEIKIEIPGSELFAKKQAKTFEEATADVAQG